MKMLILTFIFSFICNILTAPPNQVIYIARQELINPYEKIWKAICIYESSNNPLAIGDKHLKNYSYGIAQIREERLKDYYNKTGIYYTEKDMFDINKSKTVFLYYASEIGFYDKDRIIRNWNGSGRKTYIYLKKVKQLL
jgi:hypothetical protein